LAIQTFENSESDEDLKSPDSKISSTQEIIQECGPETQKTQKGFAHPDLIPLMKNKQIPLFLDGTFHCAIPILSIYFKKTWISGYKIEDWKVYESLNKLGTLSNRTINPLERFNRELNSYFPNGHPSLALFIDINKISVYYLETIEFVKKNRMKPPIHNINVVLPKIPPEYSKFKDFPKKK